MSGGRWVKEKNGDYQHYSDAEYNEKQRSEGVITSIGMVVGGAIFAYVSITDNEFVFGDFSNGAFITFCISGAALLLGLLYWHSHLQLVKSWVIWFLPVL